MSAKPENTDAEARKEEDLDSPEEVVEGHGIEEDDATDDAGECPVTCTGICT